MPQQLPDELLEEVLHRLPPHEPAELVRAALISTHWCRLVSGPGFRRRFRKFHRISPMLGFLCNLWDRNTNTGVACFVPTTTAFCHPRTDFHGMRVLDARHGRVLFEKGDRVLAVWDPVTDEVREFPFPQEKELPWTAAVICSAAGACDHIDCHHGPFLVVCVCYNYTYGVNVVYTYSFDAAAWSEPVWAQQLRHYAVDSCMGSVFVENALCFGNLLGSTALKYDLELCQASLIQLPSLWQNTWSWSSMLTTMEDGGLGLVTKDGSKLYMWSRKDTHEIDAKWEKIVIELKTMFPIDVLVTKLGMIGSSVSIIFMRTDDEVYTIDLKTYKVRRYTRTQLRTYFLT